jgi:hypothetical protein
LTPDREVCGHREILVALWVAPVARVDHLHPSVADPWKDPVDRVVLNHHL